MRFALEKSPYRISHEFYMRTMRNKVGLGLMSSLDCQVMVESRKS